MSARGTIEGEEDGNTLEHGIFGPRAAKRTSQETMKATESEYTAIEDPYKNLSQHAELLGCSKQETLIIMQKAMKDPVQL